jgi:hypothetical protein
MNKIFKNNLKVFLFVATLMFAWNCKKDEVPSNYDESQKLQSDEFRTIMETDDFSSVADSAILAIYQQNSSGKSAQNDECYSAMFSDTGYTLSFDNCSLEEGGVVLNGTLSVVYEMDNETSSFTVTYDNLSAGDILINGTRAFDMNETMDGFSIDTVSDFEITMADDSVVEETGTKSFIISFPDENTFIPVLSIEGSWTVKADGNTYVINITSALISAEDCEYIDTGVMTINKNGLEITVDFGDGTCDDVVTVTYPDGTEEELSLEDL